MCELAWASEMLQERIAPPGSASNKKGRIGVAASELGWRYSRVKDVWYRDERVSLKPKELREIEEVSGVEYGRKELREVDQIISRADALLEGHDPDFYGAFVAGLRAFFSALDRTGTQGRNRETGRDNATG